MLDPSRAGRVERRVRACDELFERVIGHELREPDGDGPTLGGLGKCSIDARNSRVPVGDGQAGDDEDELVSSVAHDQVVRPQVCLQCVSHLHQHPIPGGVSGRVVDRLEVIDIDKCQYQGPILSFCSLNLPLQGPEPGPATQGTGEEIGGGVLSLSRRRSPVCERGRSVEPGFAALAGAGSAISEGGHAVDRSVGAVGGRGGPVSGGLPSVRGGGALSEPQAVENIRRGPGSGRSTSLVGRLVSSLGFLVALSGPSISAVCRLVALHTGFAAQITDMVPPLARPVPHVAVVVAPLARPVASVACWVALVDRRASPFTRLVSSVARTTLVAGRIVLIAEATPISLATGRTDGCPGRSGMFGLGPLR